MKFFNKLKKIISKIDTPVWLEILLGVIILLRIPSFFEPYNYGDEMIYLTLGEGVRKGVPLYLGLHDNKPPLLYLTAALAGNLFWFKTLLMTFNLFSIYLFWKVVKNLIPKNIRFHKISTTLFAILTTIPTLEGNIANAENFMVVPTLLAFLWFLTKRQRLKDVFIIGVFLSLASLYKIVAAFDILALVLFWVILINKNNFQKTLKRLVFLTLGFLLPIVVTFGWYFLRGALQEYTIAAYLQNVGYVSSWRPSDAQKPFLIKNAPLLIRAGVMMVGFVILYLSKKRLSKPFILTSAWLLTTLFAVTLSERPYPHYLLQSIPPVAILLGMLFSFKNIEQSLSIIPLALFVFVPFYFKFWHYPTISYYTRFISFSTNQMSKQDYFNSFSSTVERNYKIADLLSKSSEPNEKVFVWSSDSSTIYALSKRLPPTKYVADYHFIDFSNKKDTLTKLQEGLPKFVVITDNAPEFEELKYFVKGNYYLISEIEGAEIWLRF